MELGGNLSKFTHRAQKVAYVLESLKNYEYKPIPRMRLIFLSLQEDFYEPQTWVVSLHMQKLNRLGYIPRVANSPRGLARRKNVFVLTAVDMLILHWLNTVMIKSLILSKILKLGYLQQ